MELTRKTIIGEVYSLYVADYDDERRPIEGEMGVVNYDSGEYYMVHLPSRSDFLTADGALVSGDLVHINAAIRSNSDDTNSLFRVESYSDFYRICKRRNLEE